MISTSLVILAIGATVCLLLYRIPRLACGLAMSSIVTASLLIIAASIEALLGKQDGLAREYPWPLPLGNARLALDGLSAWFLMTIGILSACVAVFSIGYMLPRAGRGSVSAFSALLCILVGLLILVVCAADAVLFLAGWEALSLTAFFLVASQHGRPEVRRGAWMYLVATHLGTALCLLPLFGILCSRAGTTEFSAFSSAFASADGAILAMLFFLGLIGFGTKAGFMPMHVWLPAAHPVAPTPVSALLSGVVVKTGIYGLLRLLSWLPPLPSACGQILLVAGVISGVMGVLYALAQHDLKRLLAYHTVENIGIIGLGIGIGMIGQSAHEPVVAVLGYSGALLHVTNHALFKGLLFLSAGTIYHGTNTLDIERLGGLARKTPFNAFMFLLGAVAICGLPPLNGFVGEWVIYGGLFSGSIRGLGTAGAMPALGLMSLALMGGLALACFSKVFGVVFLGTARDSSIHAHQTPFTMKVAMAGLAVPCVLIGLLPLFWLPLTQAAVSRLLRTTPVRDRGLESVLAPAGRLSLMAALLTCVIVGLVVLRRLVLSRAARRDAGGPVIAATWGCGYPAPTPRMQYTAASFASSLIISFRGLLWPERRLVSPSGPFPPAGHVETHVPDIAEHDFFEPVFRGLARLFTMIRTVSWTSEPKSVQADTPHRRVGPVKTLLAMTIAGLRRGSVHVCLTFIVLTLIALFAFEAVSSSATGRSTPRPVLPDSTITRADK